MAFGVKQKKVKFQNEYTIETLFEAIKDKQFTAGTPSLTKHGFVNIITFPALDHNNQVWIMMTGKNKATIQKNQEAGMGNVMRNAGMSALTHGWSDVSGTFGNTKKQCEAQVDATAKELEALGL